MKTLYFFAIQVCLLISIPGFSQFAGGDGSISNPYQVSTPDQLNEVRNHLDSYFIQIKNIDLKGYDHNNDGKGWMPIAGSGTGDQFQGHYNGQNFTITNLYIYRPESPNVGLFGHIGISDDITEISITNLGIISANVNGGRGVGALAGRVTSNSQTKIEYTYVKYGSITGDGATGGLVGSNNSYRSTANSDGYKPMISKSFSNIDVYWSERISGDKFGGLVGCSQKGIISNSYSRGTVNVDNTTAQLSSVERVGGLVGCGLQRAEIYNSYSTTYINVPSSNPTVTNVGGLMGTSDGNTTIVSSYWDTETSGTLTSYGGLGETSNDMKEESTFIGYDFSSIWGIDPNINDGYPYLKTNDDGILPVELTEFSASSDNTNINISWITESEKNNDYFILERSTNGQEFHSINTIKGSGNSNLMIKYSTTDYNPISGINYYRLKQIDSDGSFAFSPIINIFHRSEDKILSMFPNPASEYLTILTSSNCQWTYQISDYTGKTIISGKSKNTEETIDISTLNSGIYFISILENKDIIRTIKFIKE